MSNEETMEMTGDSKVKIAQSVEPNMTESVDCVGMDNTCNHNQRRRRLSSGSDSMDGNALIIAQSEKDIVTFAAEDTILLIKEGLVEGQVTIKEIAEAIHVSILKDDAHENENENFTNLYGGRRRSSVLRDRQLESAAFELGDRMI